MGKMESYGQGSSAAALRHPVQRCRRHDDNPLVTEYAMTVGADLTMASTVSGLMSITGMIACPFAGLLADRISRKWILVFANLDISFASSVMLSV